MLLFVMFSYDVVLRNELSNSSYRFGLPYARSAVWKPCYVIDVCVCSISDNVIYLIPPAFQSVGPEADAGQTLLSAGQTSRPLGLEVHFCNTNFKMVQDHST